MTHDEIRDALPAFALDALDPPEQAEVAAHLQECDACRSDVLAWHRVSDGIGLEAPPVAPPAALKARVMAGVSGTTSSPRRSWVMPIALAASLALAAGAFYYASQLRSENEPLRRMQRVLAARDLVRADLKGQDVAAAATGRAHWSASTGLVFTANQLPVLPAGRVYQLWTIRGSQATSAGLLVREPDGTVTFVAPAEPAGPVGPAAPAPPDAFGVTIEPAGGSASPTLPIVMVGAVSK